MNAYWRRGQLSLRWPDLSERQPDAGAPLYFRRREATPARPLGTTPGLNFLYVHWNRLIRERDLNMMYIIGPGHGGPGAGGQHLPGGFVLRNLSAPSSRTRKIKVFRQSGGHTDSEHVAPETPGSIHEGGELGYSLVHAYGAAFRQSESDCGLWWWVTARPRPGRWPQAGTQTSFSNPATDGGGAAHPAPERLQDCQPHGARANSRTPNRELDARLRL